MIDPLAWWYESNEKLVLQISGKYFEILLNVKFLKSVSETGSNDMKRFTRIENEFWQIIREHASWLALAEYIIIII